MVVLSYVDSHGSPHLGLIAKRAYRLHAGRCVPETTSPPIQEAPVHIPSSNPEALERLETDSDWVAVRKPWTDVLLSGSAWSVKGPVPVLDTGVSVGPLRKVVRVWGPRAVRLGPRGRMAFSEAEPFGRVPLTWDHAYGGRDRYAERLEASEPSGAPGAVCYPRNRAGRGFFVDWHRERLDGMAAPQLEDPEDPVSPERLSARGPTDWLDRPAAACYGPVDWIWFPRIAWWLGTEANPPERPLYEARHRLLVRQNLGHRTFGERVDARAFAAAPPGLAGARLTGGERVSLWNVHPRTALLEVTLPADRPALFLEPPGCPARQLTSTLQTVHFEPDEDRVTLTWTGSLETAAPYPEEMCQSMKRGVRWER